MSILLGLVTALAALLTLAVGATAFQLRSSDAAGNGLAHVFLTISAIALWVMLAIALGLATLKQPRHPMQWASINIYALLLFLLAVAGQAACLAQLTGRSVDGWYRLVLQLSMIVAPVATITHIVWRVFGAPVPMRVATLGVGVAVAAFSVLALAGLLRSKQSAPRELTVDMLAYPALLIRGTSKVVVIREQAELTSMHSNYVVNRPSDPLVIDSHFAIFELRDLKLTKSSLGMLVRGQGMEPVTFRLVPYEPSRTPESVRTLVLGVNYLSTDRDADAAMRRDLATAESLDEMIAILLRK